MRRWPLILSAVAAVAVVAAMVFADLSVGVGVALVVIAVGHLLAHTWFVTWGPNARPNRFHRRDLWENQRRVHAELRRRGHEGP